MNKTFVQMMEELGYDIEPTFVKRDTDNQEETRHEGKQNVVIF